MTSRRAARVLVLDADPDHREATREALLEGGHEVTAAATVREGLAIAERLPPHVIVVGASLAGSFDALLQGGALASVPIVAVASADVIPVADVVLPSPVDALELLATVRLLAGALSSP